MVAAGIRPPARETPGETLGTPGDPDVAGAPIRDAPSLEPKLLRRTNSGGGLRLAHRSPSRWVLRGNLELSVPVHRQSLVKISVEESCYGSSMGCMAVPDSEHVTGPTVCLHQHRALYLSYIGPQRYVTYVGPQHDTMIIMA